MDEADAALFVALQRGLPFVERPFARTGRALGLGEDDVLRRVRAWCADGTARRLGGVFRSRALGYAGLLCALDAGPDACDALAAVVNRRRNVTHNYARDGRPRLWFTLTAPADRLGREVAALERDLGREVIRLPATQRYKTRVILDPVAGRADAPPPGCAAAADERAVRFDDADRALVQALQDSIPLEPEPFAAVADAAGLGAADVLSRLHRWTEAGALARVALIPHHRRLGFGGNALCAWDVPADRIDAAGLRLAAEAEVTHCYARRRHPRFPRTLYAMTHRRTPAEAQATFARLDALVPDAPGVCLLSTKEYAKRSPRYFAEAPSEDPS